MSQRRQQRMREELAKLAASFFAGTSPPQSLITVTAADISPDLSRATIYLSVFPTELEEQALAHASQSARRFRSHFALRAQLRHTPEIRFELDRGEQNRRRIDELLNE